LMPTGCEALEEMAADLASRELNSLINRRPTFANVLAADGVTVNQVPIAEVTTGDVLIVRGSEVIPVDGELISERAALDESSVTGEEIPVTNYDSYFIISGSVNGTVRVMLRAMT